MPEQEPGKLKIRVHGTDPKLNEQGLLQTVQDEERYLSGNGYRTLISLILLATYDRQVKRKFYAEMLDITALMSISIAELEGAAKVRHILTASDPPQDVAQLDEAAMAIQHKLLTQRKQLAEKFALVCECPTEEDAIN